MASPATLASTCGRRVVITGALLSTSWARPSAEAVPVFTARFSRWATERTTVIVRDSADLCDSDCAMLTVLLLMFDSVPPGPPSAEAAAGEA